jgi:hypothetical protein
MPELSGLEGLRAREAEAASRSQRSRDVSDGGEGGLPGRDERDGWSGIEAYLARRTDAAFSHGVCPDCYASVVQPEIDALKRDPG